MTKLIFDMSMSLDGFVKGASSNSRQRSSSNHLPSQCHRRPRLSRLWAESQFWDQEGATK